MKRGISADLNLVTGTKYTVRLAQNNEEVLAAQRLRFNVFNLELNEGLDESYSDQLDHDRYDEQCHHLLVLHRESDTVVGTYRMQTWEMAARANGFYTAGEFNISALPNHILKNSVEVGRACIDKNHRNGRVLYLLWRGLAEFMCQMKTRYLFGCCSISSQDSVDAWQIMEFLRQKGYCHPEICIETQPEFTCDTVRVGDTAWLNVKLPQLFRLYIELGAKVCSLPAMDRSFRTIDYLILLDTYELDERSRLLFFK